MSLFEDLLTPENFYYAWRKTKNIFRTADGYVDRAELAAFELNLEWELADIRARFRRADYQLRPLFPLPRPKKLNDDGAPVDRQYFHVSVRDQVAWIALTNVMGPLLDLQMPAWSYGNRIFRATWYDEGAESRSKLEIGPYRHASGHLYRKFQSSWPLFRRHVALTAKAMVHGAASLPADEDNADRVATAAAKADGLQYLDRGFWPKKQNKDLYHASIDLETFYPSIHRDAVQLALLNAIPSQSDADLAELIGRMLDFRVELAGTPNFLLGNVSPPVDAINNNGLPTGLFAAGFLANAVMLQIDLEVDKIISKRRELAHFRFVDDHTLIAYDFDKLCLWIQEYKSILARFAVGAVINDEKYDPLVLGSYLKQKSQEDSAPGVIESLRKQAHNETRIDGTNPTRLQTKTLEQVSAIATATVDALDDEDLKDRLKLLEWLLLADIPEREIRPDTRAAFAAGKMATLVPLLVQEGDGLIDDARKLAELEDSLRALKRKGTTKPRLSSLRAEIDELRGTLKIKKKEHDNHEAVQLRRCFSLLMQAFKEFPGKPRLFYRMHQYCQLTGHFGLAEIRKWIIGQRKSGHRAWADYYAYLSFQILSDTVLKAAHTLLQFDSLHADKIAARRHLEDLSRLRTAGQLADNEAWFHVVARQELAVSMFSASTALRILGQGLLGTRLEKKAREISTLSPNEPSPRWEEITGYSAGVWAYRVEQILSPDGLPSPAWKENFSTILDYRLSDDMTAARRYPEFISESAWSYLIGGEWPLQADDGGWVFDSLVSNPERIPSARQSTQPVILKAASSLDESNSEWITAGQWIEYLKECEPFDPRRGEWTSLEIVRQIIAPLETDLTIHWSTLDRIHQANVQIPNSWKRFSSAPSWESWKKHAAENPARFKPNSPVISDYRYSSKGMVEISGWEEHLTAIGRLLLGLLRLQFDAPRSWNIRGNEKANPFSRGTLYQALGISSPTLLFLEACLSGRSAENRELRQRPSLFGWDASRPIPDIEFDAPLLDGPSDVVRRIKEAQDVLTENQIAVSKNRPRQLIPFRLADFAVGVDDNNEDEEHAE